MNREHLKAIIFDFHGTLAFKEQSVTPEDVSRVLHSAGLDIGPQEWEAANRFVFFIDLPREKFQNWKEYRSRIFDRLGFDFTEGISQALDELFTQGNIWRVYPEVPGVLEAVAGAFKLGIATTIPSFQILPILGDLASHFKFVGTGDTVGRAKGSHSFYLTIARKLDVEPNECLLVGDDILLDIEIPHSLGFHTAQLIRTGKSPCEDADFHIQTLREIEGIVRQVGDPE